MVFTKLLRFGWLILVALIVTGCGTQGFQLEESTFLRYLEKKSGLIAYQAMDGNLYTINQAGEETVQLTDDVEGLPPEVIFGLRAFAWSKGDGQLAYIGFTPENWTIEVSDPKGEETTRVFADNLTQPVYLSWGAGGRQITFLTATDPMTNNGKPWLSLRSVPVSGNGEASLLAEGYPLFYSWEPGGDRALTHVGGSRAVNENARISIFTLNSTFEIDLGLPPAQFQTPAWSPDGTEFLMAINDVQGRNVLVTVGLQGQVRQTVREFSSAISFAWSPDSRLIAYIESERTRQGASGPLTVYDSVLRENLFTTEETMVHAFFWSPNGEEIVYFTQELVNEEGQGELIAGLRMHILNVKDREVRHMQFGPDAYVFQPTPQFFRFLSAFDQYSQSATIWSPNGEYIVLPVVGDGQGLILAIATSGGIQPRLLTDGVMALWSWE